MAKKSTFETRFSRRSQGKTNYRKRLALVKSGLHRLVVRRSNRYVVAQVIEFSPQGDKTVVHVNSSSLEKFGWTASKKNMGAAYLTGLLAGKKAVQKKVERAILDIGFVTPKHKGWWASVLKGALDAGLKINADEAVLPGEERVSGKHVEAFAKLGKKPGNAFSKFGEKNAAELGKMFEEVKKKILESK
jgi:large subunit ribosomal protein L18